MSPQVAMHDPVFRSYLIIAAVVLVVAGAILALLRWALRKDVTSLWKTYRSWLIMAPLIFGLIWAGRVATIVGFSLIALVGFKEFSRATGLYRDWWITGTVYLGIVAIALIAIFPHP